MSLPVWTISDISHTFNLLPVIAELGRGASIWNQALMLPGLRTLLAAVFVTAIVATLVAAALMPTAGESFTHAMTFLQVEKSLVWQARIANPKQQFRMLGDAPAGLPSRALGTTATTDGGTSTYAKTQMSLGPNPADRVAQSSAWALAPDQPSANSNTQSDNPAVTGSVNRPSIVTVKLPPQFGSEAAWSAVVQNQNAHNCGPCSQDHRQWRNGRVRFRGFGRFTLHARDLRLVTFRSRRSRLSADRNSAI